MPFTSTTTGALPWLVNGVPALFTLAGVLIALAMLRGALTTAVAHLQHTARLRTRRRAVLKHPEPPGSVSSGRAGQGRQEVQLLPDPALLFLPQTYTAGQLVLFSAASISAVLLTLSLLMPAFLALVLAGPVTAGLIGLMLANADRRYAHRIDQDLTAAVGRLAPLMRSGKGFRNAVEQVLHDMGDTPLKDEWSFLITRVGTPLNSGGIATIDQVAAALMVQTLSRRHATFLNHMVVALTQPLNAQVLRLESAYAAMQRSDRRRSEALTQLAQVRYGGLVVGLAGVVMAVYLFWSQWERAVIAYSSGVGPLMAVCVGAALAAPILGGLALAQVADLDY